MAQNSDNPDLSTSRLGALQAVATRLRLHSLLSTTAAGSGHPSTCFSCAEIVSTVFFEFMRFDLENPHSPFNDRFVLSKGHAAPILWAILAEAGAFPREELMSLRRITSLLEGHPTPRSPYVDVATGSLGQGLSNAVGMALASRLRQVGNRVFVLMGDGETAEGAVWEAAALASHYNLRNLIAIVDVNRLGQSEPTMYGHDLTSYERKFQAFGWRTAVVDGHSIPEIRSTLAAFLSDPSGPAVMIAHTLKGKGVSFMENAEGWHGKPVTNQEQVAQALEELGHYPDLPEVLELQKPTVSSLPFAEQAAPSQPDYLPGQMVATREAYGEALRKLGLGNPNIVALDGDCKNSTFSEKFKKQFPDRFYECYIAEQNMVGAAAGLAAMGLIPFASSFACFLTRAYDFIRMAGISQVNLKLCGSHAGVSIGEDGPSQMALEDLAMMRAVPGSAVLYPSDAVSTERLVQLAAETRGIVYIRTSRPKTAVIYPRGEVFSLGGSKVLRNSEKDVATLVGAGVTLHESLKAQEILSAEGIQVRVIDLYSLKPIDSTTLRKAALETGLVITVEDHYPEGGIGEAVLSALAGLGCKFRSLAVDRLPRSGSPGELMDSHGISAESIVTAVKDALVSG